MNRVPLRLVLVGEIAWRVKRAIDCVLGFTGRRRWEP